MSKRLESLNSKKPLGGPKPSLKFKPKSVARRSKEERAKDAPVQVKEEPSFRPSTRGGSTRGRGRGGRANYAGTHVVLAGPLASGSVSMGNVNANKLGFTHDKTYNVKSETPDFLQNLKSKAKVKENGTGERIQTEEDEEDDDITKINMSKEYNFEASETVLFPVRPDRLEESVSPSGSKEATPAPEAKETTESRLASVEVISATDSRIKSEPLEEKLRKIKAHKEEIESKIAEPVDLLDKEEYNKILDDHLKILDIITGVEALTTEPSSEKYILFHLPKVLPVYEQANGVVDMEQEKEQEEEQVESKDKSPFASDVTAIRGQIGHLNIHKSGKITINLGNDNNLAVSQGMDSTFLQDLVLLETEIGDQAKPQEDDVEMADEPIKGNMFHMGKVEGKIIGTPLLL